MTWCNLLNIARVKQIVPRVQIWFYGSSCLWDGSKSILGAKLAGRIFVLLRPVKSSEIVEQGELAKTLDLFGGLSFFKLPVATCLRTLRVGLEDLLRYPPPLWEKWWGIGKVYAEILKERSDY